MFSHRDADPNGLPCDEVGARGGTKLGPTLQMHLHLDPAQGTVGDVLLALGVLEMIGGRGGSRDASQVSWLFSSALRSAAIRGNRVR